MSSFREENLRSRGSSRHSLSRIFKLTSGSDLGPGAWYPLSWEPESCYLKSRIVILRTFQLIISRLWVFFWKSGYSSDNLYCQQIEKDPPKLNLTQSCIDLRLIVLSKVKDVSDSETQSKVQLFDKTIFLPGNIHKSNIWDAKLYR